MASIDDELEAIERAAAGGPSMTYAISPPTPINSSELNAPKLVEPVSVSASAAGRGRSRGRGRRGPRKGSLCNVPSVGAYTAPPPQYNSPYDNNDDDDDDDDDDGLLVGFPTRGRDSESDDDVAMPKSHKAGATVSMRPGGGSSQIMRTGNAPVMRPGGRSDMPVTMRPGGRESDMPPIMRPSDGPVVMRPGGSGVPQTMRPGGSGAPVMIPSTTTMRTGGGNAGAPPSMRPGELNFDLPQTMQPTLANDEMYTYSQSNRELSNTVNIRDEFVCSKSERLSVDHPNPPVHLPHENKIEVPRSTLRSGDSYVAEMLRQRFEQEQQAKRTGNIDDLSDDEGVNDFDDALHLGVMPKNMGSGTPAAHRPLVGGFAAAAYEAARAYHFQNQGAQLKKSTKSNRQPPSI